MEILVYVLLDGAISEYIARQATYFDDSNFQSRLSSKSPI
jgi:hypothetical protein